MESGNGMEEKKLTHVDELGQARMVDVSEKAETERLAVARGRITMSAACLAVIEAGTAPKGEVLATARIAGIMAAKKTSELIPLCHQIPLTGVKLHFTSGLIAGAEAELSEPGEPVEREARDTGKRGFIQAECAVRTKYQTGVEMEAMTAVSVALLTIYDMCKAIDRSMEIGGVRLEYKSGGASGVFRREESGKGERIKAV